MSRRPWLAGLSCTFGRRAPRRRRLFRPHLLSLEPRKLLSVQAIAGAAGIPFVEGTSSTVNLAQFSVVPNDTSLLATVDWGDGKTDPGQFVIGSDGLITVSGQHAYSDSGNFSPVVTLTEVTSSSSASVTATAVVSEDFALLTTATPVTGTENVPLGNIQVASLTTRDADVAASDLTATIDWGDAVTSAGTVSPGGPGTFLITGAHTYLDEGPYPITVVVDDADSANAATTIATMAAIAKGPTGGIAGTSAQDFVGHAFRDILDRPADQPSFKSVSQSVLQGTSFVAVADMLTHSPEYYALVVDHAYASYLGRSPDAGGLAYWVRKLEQGLTDEDLAAQIIASDDYFNHAGDSNDAWIKATYQSLLGRPADDAGASFFVGGLSHGLTRLQVAQAIATSVEHERLDIQADYAHYLGRAAGDDEVDFWVSKLIQGLSDEDVITQIVTSNEYLQRISS
jgi:hypothetical protein